MAKRLQWLFAFLTVLSGAVFLYAQNPVSIAQIGTTAVTTTVPVSGTVAATQSGTWTVQPGNTANTTAWKVDGSAVTQPVSLASVPSHAVTNAGTFATQSAITAASGSISSGAIASGAMASGAVASGAYASGSIADGAMVTLGAKADAKSTATDTTAITVMQVLKEISAMAQAPAALPANQSTNVAQIGGTATVISPCETAVPTVVAISQTASTKVISQASSKKNYICSIVVVAGAAEIVNLVEGTGSTCGTSTAAIVGSTTAANGMSFAANGGFAAVAGKGVAIPGSGSNVDTCLTQSGSNRVSGFLSYVQQ